MIADLLLVLVGGLVGAPTRYAIGVAVKSRVHSVFPYGTLTANALACLLLGFFVEAATGGDLGPRPELLLATGFCGALSTWSTFSYEVLTLASARRLAVMRRVSGSQCGDRHGSVVRRGRRRLRPVVRGGYGFLGGAVRFSAPDRPDRSPGTA